MKIESKMKRSQALAEGYTYFLLEKHNDFQVIKELDRDFEGSKSEVLILCEKESYTIGVSPEAIAEIIADQAVSWVGEDSGDDDLDDMYRDILALDFTDVAERVTAVMSKKEYYRPTTIQVIPD